MPGPSLPAPKASRGLTAPTNAGQHPLGDHHRQRPGVGEKLRDLARRQAMGLAALVVFLGDGAAWVWELARVWFPFAKLSLDFYHAAEHVGLLCEILFGKETPPAQAQREAWVKILKDQEQGVDQVIQQAKAALPRRGPRRPQALKALAYFENNRDKMRYWDTKLKACSSVRAWSKPRARPWSASASNNRGCSGDSQAPQHPGHSLRSGKRTIRPILERASPHRANPRQSRLSLL